ncbi:HAD family hydrolase [Rhodospirillum rubrum]|uniref:HAD family hydrolase n=1 Tax=Rhodospirillum rubrum TaxID=1085 RepID=UPI0019081159|nr:HAD family phosphatase [Rhodospirillum rubrum]MBK1663037.1 HAD family hydrolase [Rhodospirillum rubrum]MBK1677627.1 HAD family hydrolase [Rhodospirillum rubrum]
MTPPKAIAWDIDGTLIDSEPTHLRALITVSAAHGVDLTTGPADRFLGVHMADVWTLLRPQYTGGLTYERWLAEIIACYGDDRATLAPMPGALDTVAAFAAAGIPQACVSNSLREIVDANLAVLGIAPDLAFSLSFEDVPAGKPDPAPYRLAARRFGVDPASVWAIEDSLTGARSALDAGLTLFLLGDHPGRPIPPGAIRISSVSEVLTAFQKLAA